MNGYPEGDSHRETRMHKEKVEQGEIWVNTELLFF